MFGSDQRHEGRRLRAAGRILLRYAPIAVAALAVVAAVPAFAATLSVRSSRLTAWQSATAVCSSPGTQTLTAVADAYVEEDSNNNFGTETALWVQADATGDAQRTLVRFSLATIPSGCSVTAATLRLYAAQAVTGRTLQAYRAGTSWSETSVSWDDNPTLAGTAVTTASATGWREWDVVTHVTAHYSGPNNGFVIKDASEASGDRLAQRFNSRQNILNKPQLLVTFG